MGKTGMGEEASALESNFDLDDVGIYGQLDPSGMTAAIESFPDQCRKAEKMARDLMAQYPAEDIREVVVLGMGGSAIGGDIIKALLENALSMPVTVHRGYCPCKYYSPHTLLFAVSYSGNTEETLSSLDDAVYQNCKVVAITSGGSLLQKAQGYRWPLLQVPEGLQPRAALPWLTLPMAVMLEKMGMVRDFSRVLGGTMTSLDTRARQWGRLQPAGENFAKQLAQRLYGKVPVIYGMEGPLSVAAYRWKCQINENSKVPAFHHVIPEMNHNEIVGWEELDDFSRLVEVVFLVDEEDNPRLVHRARITSELIKDKVGGVSVVHVSGSSRTEKLLSTILLGDFVSVYLALLNGRDPTPVERISQLKARMAEVKDEPACFGE
jgi:glucose/mannose-6-phosphate isomerase